MILDVSHLGHTYPGSAHPVLRDVNFHLDQGDILSILGPNGSGKTTLLRCLMNLETPNEGNILLNRQPMEKMGKKNRARAMGYVPQFHDIPYAYTVVEFVTMGRTPYTKIFSSPSKKDERLAMAAIQAMGISHLAPKNFSRLSGGEKQQVMLARILTQNPQVILLDEPCNHLDYGNQIRTLKMLHDLSHKGYTIIMTTHNPDHALMLGGKAAIVDKNRPFCFGRTQEVVTREKLKHIYRLDIEMMAIENRTICLPPALDTLIEEKEDI